MALRKEITDGTPFIQIDLEEYLKEMDDTRVVVSNKKTRPYYKTLRHVSKKQVH